MKVSAIVAAEVFAEALAKRAAHSRRNEPPAATNRSGALPPFRRVHWLASLARQLARRQHS